MADKVEGGVEVSLVIKRSDVILEKRGKKISERGRVLHCHGRGG